MRSVSKRENWSLRPSLMREAEIITVTTRPDN